jgi:hypothetical protein
MLRRILMGLLWAVPGYLAGAFGGGYLVSVMSANQHDRSLEAAMTGAFFFGPLAALVAFIVGAVRARRPSGADRQ